MGTRHLTAVVLNGDFKVAQYGQWDGFTNGQLPLQIEDKTEP